MYEKRVLGDFNGYSLINSMWLICITHFGMRTGKKTHNRKWGDIRLELDPQSGSEYIQLDTERQTKTRTAEDPETQGYSGPLFCIIIIIIIIIF